MPLKSDKLEISKKYIESWENSLNLITQLISIQELYVLVIEGEKLEIVAKSHFLDKDFNTDNLKKGGRKILGEALQKDEPLVISDKNKTLLDILHKSISKDISSFFSVKISYSKDNFFGLLCAHNKKSTSFTELEIDALKEIRRIIEKDLTILEKNNLISGEISKRKEIEQELRATNEELKTGLEKKHSEIDEISQSLKDIQEDYKLIVENQNALIVKFDKNFKLTYISPQYAHELGSTSKDLIGQSFFPFIHEDDIENVKMSHENLKRKPYECTHEERMRTINGWRWFLWANKSIVNKNGYIEGIVGVGRDITERKKIESDLNESKERYRLAMKGANDGLWDNDLITSEIYYSKRWKTMLGYQEDELENS